MADAGEPAAVTPVGAQAPSWNAASLRLAAVALAIASVSTFLRVYKLPNLLPVLVDEAIYLRWAEIIDHQGEWFISLLDGKQPLSYWLLFAMRRFGPADSLLGGRILSATAGVLATMAILGFGSRLAGWRVGAGAALFYAVLPYGVLYDHLAYTDALANLCAVLVAWTSYECFRASTRLWPATLATGLALGAGALVKTTVLQFALFPLAFGLLFCRNRPLLLASRLASIYAIPAALLALTSAFRPIGPRAADINPVVHRADFFLPFRELATAGPDLLQYNVRLFSGYLGAYVTPAIVVAAAVGIVWAARRRDLPMLAAIAAGLLPLLPQLMLLRYFPSRYLFPHAWSLLLAAAYLVAAAGRAGEVLRLALVMVLVARTSGLLGNPSAALHPRDAAEFAGSGPYSGYGVKEASSFLMHEAEAGSLVLLTDPYWGPPADAMFAYLQGRNGIVVYEAWWLQVKEERYPIVPLEPVPVMKSQYQRINAGTVDFSSCCSRIYYVTDTNYHSEADVTTRQPGARLAARFMKPNRRDSIDVYRLR